MRMWKVDPKKMCRKHLLGEHVEMHMFVGTINRGTSIEGYIREGLVEVHNIKERHRELALEIERRGYHHQSPLPEFPRIEAGRVSIRDNESELDHRCRECQFNQIKIKEGDPKMKLNAAILKSLTEKQVKETIALLNHEPFFQGNPIRGKRHANKTVLTEIMVDRVLEAADRGVKIPEEIDVLVGKLVSVPAAPVSPTPSTTKTTMPSYEMNPIDLPEPVIPGKAKPKKAKGSKEPRVTKKSIVIDLVSRNGGATVEEMADACTNAGLGDLKLNKKICRLWLSKLGFKVVKSEGGHYSRA